MYFVFLKHINMDNSIVKMGMIKYDDGKEYGAFFEIAGITFKLQKVKTKQAATLEVKRLVKAFSKLPNVEETKML
jgi:hypothetical protein